MRVIKNTQEFSPKGITEKAEEKNLYIDYKIWRENGESELLYRQCSSNLRLRIINVLQSKYHGEVIDAMKLTVRI